MYSTLLSYQRARLAGIPAVPAGRRPGGVIGGGPVIAYGGVGARCRCGVGVTLPPIFVPELQSDAVRLIWKTIMAHLSLERRLPLPHDLIGFLV